MIFAFVINQPIGIIRPVFCRAKMHLGTEWFPVVATFFILAKGTGGKYCKKEEKNWAHTQVGF
jgi:hypothetical protein